jgi:hypothetical protein
LRQGAVREEDGLGGCSRVSYSLRFVTRRSVDSLDFVGGGSHDGLESIVGSKDGRRFECQIVMDVVVSTSYVVDVKWKKWTERRCGFA